MGGMQHTEAMASGLWSTGLFRGTITPLYEQTEALTVSFVDFVRLGDSLVLDVLTTDASGTPTDADSNPTYTIYSADRSSVLVSGGTTAKLGSETGVYLVSQAIAASAGFAAGNTYALLAKWEIASSSRQKIYTFKVD